MDPTIEESGLGYITIGGEKIKRDVFIRLSGKVKKRGKKASKAKLLHRSEVKDIYRKGAERLIVGSGHDGSLVLTEKAAAYLKDKECDVHVLPTPEAVEMWNGATGWVIGLFHVDS